MSTRATKRLRYLTTKVVPPGGAQSVAAGGDVTFLPMEAIGEQGELDVSRSIGLEHGSGYTLFFEGDVVVAKITPCFENGKGAVIAGTSTGIGLGTSELYVLRPKAGVDARFLYYVTVDPSFRTLGETQMTGAAGQKRVPEDFVRDYPVSLPSFAVQTATASYLDVHLGRTDGLISSKTRWLDLLAEKRLAVVAAAIMRGIDTSAPMRRSGISWLGDIPAHWKVRRIATLFQQRDERSEPDLPLLEVSINAGVAIREFTGEGIEGTAADFNAYKVARRGDIAFNKMRMWQGAVGVSPTDGLVSPDYTVAVADASLRPDFAGQLFRTQAFSAECARNSVGITWDRLRLYWDGFRDIYIPVPPLEEQDAILRHIDSETTKIDRLSEATEHSIALLKERRAALIAAAVTGQIEIPEAA